MRLSREPRHLSRSSRHRGPRHLDRDTPRHPQGHAERTMPNQVSAYVKNAENSTTKWHLSYGA